MLIFVQNCAWVLAMLFALGIAGGVAAHPFARILPFSPLIRPLAGLLLVAISTLALYVVLRLPMETAGAISWSACCLLSLVVSRIHRSATVPRADHGTLAILSVGVIALATAISTATSIRHGSPSFLYLDGTDHLGYAHMADWLNQHLVIELPRENAAEPYSSWPSFLVSFDPRFASFTTLALVSQVLGRSGMFSYDIACALVLSTTVLALAAVFAKTRLCLVLLVLALFTCHWFDYNRSGFFAKAIAYPSIFFVVGLFMVAVRRSVTPFVMSVLVLLTVGAALMQSGASAALFLAVLGGTYLAAAGGYELWQRHALGLAPLGRSRAIREGAIVLGLLIALAVISSGTLARPLRPGFPDWGYPWDVIFPRVADLEAQTLSAAVMQSWQVRLALIVSAVLWAGLALMSVLYRNAVATALIVGPAGLLIILRLTDQRAMAFQMIGVFYPLAVCGAAALAGSEGPVRRLGWRFSFPKPSLALAFIGVAIALHCPRFVNSGFRYSLRAPVERQFEAREMQELVSRIGYESVEVAVGYDLHLTIAVLVELGRQGIALQWSADSWRAVLGYRPGWPVPSYPEVPPLRLVRRDAPVPPGQRAVFETHQFKLVRTSPARHESSRATAEGEASVVLGP